AFVADNIGIVLRRLGDLLGAQAEHETALDIRRKLGDQPGEARALSQLSVVARQQGELAMAEGYARDAIRLLSNGDDPRALAAAHASLGELHEARKAYPEAAREYLESLELTRTAPNPDNIGMALARLARVHIALNELSKAESYARDCLDQ